MTPFAAITLDPGSVIAWVAVGLIAGFLAGRVMSGGGYGVVGDLAVGLAGALIGGFLFGQFVTGTPGLIGSIVVAFVGACVLIWLLRLVAPGPVRI
jgi:uncharacterized membrane protein YeaQ/YmgE (transglycosylase-associated protein family)